MNATPDVTILLVDDDEGHAELVRLNLIRSNISNEIKYFNNGADIIDFFVNHPEITDKRFLVLLDLNMPGTDGHQVLRWLKSNEDTKSIPVIILTTAAEDKEVARAYASGCNMFLTKPLDYDAFSNAIEQLGFFLTKTRIPGMIKLAADNA